MNQIFLALLIIYSLFLSFSCNTNERTSESTPFNFEDNSLFTDSLDADTSRNYIHNNIPQNLHAETDSVFEILKSIENSVDQVSKIKKKLIALDFHPLSDNSHFTYFRKRFNRRIYVYIQDTLVRNKKIIIDSYFWDNGKKYNNVTIYSPNRE